MLLFVIGYGSGARPRTYGAMHSEAKTPPKDVHLSDGNGFVEKHCLIERHNKKREVVLMSYKEEYQKKLVSPEKAVKVVKSGDWIEYGFGHTKPIALDKALAARKDELKDINIRHTLSLTQQACIEVDPEGDRVRVVLIPEVAVEAVVVVPVALEWRVSARLGCRPAAARRGRQR